MQINSSNVVLNKMQISLKANKIRAKETTAKSKCTWRKWSGQ